MKDLNKFNSSAYSLNYIQIDQIRPNESLIKKHKLTKKTQSGFSLIELLIVVVIIGIIAAIAIPNLLAARRSANEGSAQATYQSTIGDGDFANNFGQFERSISD